MRLEIYDKWQKLLFADTPSDGHSSDGKRVISNKILRSDEDFFGLGEKTGSMSRRGKEYKMWNSDKPCYSISEDPLYKSIPFFMSNYHYGILFDNTFKTVFRFGTEGDGHYSFEAPDGPMKYYFIAGSDYKDILNGYIALTGQPIMPPKWALGFSQCRGLYTNEQLARDVATMFREKQIPCDVIYQDIGWTEYLQNFTWSDKYSNPEKMLHDLSDMGFKVILSQDPVVSQKNVEQWSQADSLGYFTKDIRTGKTYDMPWPWGGNCGVVDFTNPQVAEWWGDYQQKPIEMGAKGFWTDMGEPAWSNEESTDRLFMKHMRGMHDEIHNVYGLTWDSVVTSQLYRHNPGKRVFQMTRAAYAGVQRYAFSWTGDSGNGADPTRGWKQMAAQIPILLSAGLCGIPFVTCDISGYCGDINDYQAMTELYIRWMQMGIFTPLSRAHHEGNWAVEPWQFGEKGEVLSRAAIEMKYTLMPYIYGCARESYDNGYPIMRAMFFEYPDDPECYHSDAQFMLGGSILIAPVVEEGADTKQVYFPEGEWIGYDDGLLYRGGRTVEVNAPIWKLPVFIKQGSIIFSQPVVQYIEQEVSMPIYADVYPSKKKSEAVLYEDDGESLDYQDTGFLKRTMSVSPVDGGFQLKMDGMPLQGWKPENPRNIILRVHLQGKPSKVILNGVQIKSSKWSWDKAASLFSYDLGKCMEEINLQIVTK